MILSFYLDFQGAGKGVRRPPFRPLFVYRDPFFILGWILQTAISHTKSASAVSWHYWLHASLLIDPSSKTSRQDITNEILKRAAELENDTVDWYPIMIYPEGTCGNRTALMSFKAGAFLPGLQSFQNSIFKILWNPTDNVIFLPFIRFSIFERFFTRSTMPQCEKQVEPLTILKESMIFE